MVGRTQPITLEKMASFVRGTGRDRFTVSEASKALQCHPSSVWNFLHGAHGKSTQRALAALLGVSSFRTETNERTGKTIVLVPAEVHAPSP